MVEKSLDTIFDSDMPKDIFTFKPNNHTAPGAAGLLTRDTVVAVVPVQSRRWNDNRVVIQRPRENGVEGDSSAVSTVAIEEPSVDATALSTP